MSNNRTVLIRSWLRRRHLTWTPLLLLLAIAATGCDDDPTGVEPDVDELFTFEDQLEGWTPAGTDLDDPPVDWSIERSDEEAESGSHSLRLFLNNMNDAGKIWVQRPFQVSPDQQYKVEVSFSFGTADFGSVNHWSIITGAHLDAPLTREELTFQDETANGSESDVGLRWLEKSYTLTIASDSEGEIWVTVGVWGRWETPRTYYVDNLRIRIIPQ